MQQFEEMLKDFRNALSETQCSMWCWLYTCIVDVLVQLLDKEDYQSGIEEIIDSIQYKKLNK